MKIKYEPNGFDNVEDVPYGTFIMHDRTIYRVGRIFCPSIKKPDGTVAVVIQETGSITTLPFRTKVEILPEPTLVF